MWWENWIPESYLYKSTVCAVECLFLDSDIKFNFSIVTLKKNKIETLIKETSSTDLLKISQLAKKYNAPLIISITGKGVISKQVLLRENENLNTDYLVKQYFPTIDPENFYIQFFKSKNNTGFLSLCRKDQVNNMMKEFLNSKNSPIDVFIGAFSINSLSPITRQLNFIYSISHQFEITEGYIQKINIKENNETNTIGNLEISPQEIIPFSTAFSYLTKQNAYTSSNIELTSLMQNYQQKLKLNILLFTFVAFIFIVSVLNSVLFFNIFEEHNQLEVELNLYESKNAKITELLSNYEKKKSLIEQAGIFENKKLSVFADKIGSSLPNEIVLKELYFNPEIGETEEDSLVNFNKNQLLIKGNCNKSYILNEWINVLKNQNFIKNVNLKNFIYNSSSHLPNFILEIEIN